MLDLDDVVRQNRQHLKPAALAVSKAAGFSLELPCCLVEDGVAITTNLAGLRGHLPCSVALASASIERFLLLRMEHGFDGAFELCSTDDAEGQAFCEAWDEAQNDRAGGVVVTLNDRVAMVEQAKKGWDEAPRRMLVVARRGQTVTSGLVAADWVLAG